jgi:ankyrin repeat protein
MLKSNEKKLLRACKHTDLKAVQALIDSHYRKWKTNAQKQSFMQDFDLDCREPKFHMTPLMIASLKGSKEIVIFLISCGANIHSKDIKGYINIRSSFENFVQGITRYSDL